MPGLHGSPGQWRLLGERPVARRLPPIAKFMRVRPTRPGVTRESPGRDLQPSTGYKSRLDHHPTTVLRSAGRQRRKAGTGEGRNSTSPRPGGGRAHSASAGEFTLTRPLCGAPDMSTALTVLAGRLGEPRLAGKALWLPDSGKPGPSGTVAFTPAGRITARDVSNRPE